MYQFHSFVKQLFIILKTDGRWFLPWQESTSQRFPRWESTLHDGSYYDGNQLHDGNQLTMGKELAFALADSFLFN